jgi:hypothetical protein
MSPTPTLNIYLFAGPIYLIDILQETAKIKPKSSHFAQDYSAYRINIHYLSVLSIWLQSLRLQ